MGTLRPWRIVLVLAAMSTLSACALALVPVVASGVMVGASSDKDSKPTMASAEAPPPVSAQPAASPLAAPAPGLPAPLPMGVPLASIQLTSFDPAFALFAQRALTIAATHNIALAQDETAVAASALLADPVALDGKRAPCLADHPAAVLIDLDPADGTFVPPSRTTQLEEHAAALARLRESGILIGWVTQSSITQTGPVRSALEQSGLDPRGQDVLLLIASEGDRKQSLRENFARSACIIAIAGDDRTDFDERFRYLRNPVAGARLDSLIGDVWHLVRPLFPATSTTGTPNP